MSEFLHQCSLFEWARLQHHIYPGLDLLEGSMNGVRLTPAQAGKAKAAGMLKGSHDVKLPVARGPYIGLSIELKYKKNKPTAEQLDYGERMHAQGHKVAYCWDWVEARDIIIAYLALPAGERGLCLACAGSILQTITEKATT